jgi:DNA-binding MarR family transcriptional regulator
MVGSICDLLQQAALVARRIVVDEEDESGTTPSQKRLIARIRLDGSSTVNLLAREMGVRPPVVSRMVRGFERYGYVQWRADGGRGMPVVLTRQGESVRRLALPVEDVEARLTKHMSNREIAELKRLLEMVKQRG